MPVHPIPPLYDTDSEILILGSFPSVKSREAAFFYGHPQNRFWKVLAAVLEDFVPQTVEEKCTFLHKHHVALWDVIGACDIDGSADSSIRNVVSNDLTPILENTKIRRIYLNGRTTEKVYKKFQAGKIRMDAVCLPSTSPANAAFRLEDLINAWRVIRMD
ncbi:MAG: DNA-deoxyinosine glycosylase [Clostridia bacterium]|nr:DNA-deoxyinosine glycosylase [Clostridia bacterium]MBQ4086960.1 DNA-deoxyinosine glycosylase [Clostridia bacterium]